MALRRSLLPPAGLLVALLAFPSYSGAQLPPVGTLPPPPAKPPPSPQEPAPKVGEKAPDFTLPDKYGAPVKLSALLATPLTRRGEERRKDPWVLLVFYRGYWCPVCNSNLRNLQNHLDKFTAQGVRIVAVGIDPPDVTRKHVDKQGYSFTFLSDMEAEVIGRYDLLHEGGGPRRADVSHPAQFLIDSTGTVRWRNLAKGMPVVRPQDILRVIDELTLASSSAPE
ncbi:MAG: peroxiredoxin family protein [Terriglobia bacterium]